MTQGKKICELLKSIRIEFAHANGIKYEPVECHHEGECQGTCPACDAEARYLNRQMELRHLAGKTLRVASLSLGVATLSACGFGQVRGELVDPNYDSLHQNEKADSLGQKPSADTDSANDQSLNIMNF